MTAKDIYSKYYTRNKTPDITADMVEGLQPRLRIHASHGNNLLGDVKDEVNQYVHDMTIKGFLVRRIPTVDILPTDTQRVRNIEKHKQLQLKKLGKNFDNKQEIDEDKHGYKVQYLNQDGGRLSQN